MAGGHIEAGEGAGALDLVRRCLAVDEIPNLVTKRVQAKKHAEDGFDFGILNVESAACSSKQDIGIVQYKGVRQRFTAASCTLNWHLKRFIGAGAPDLVRRCLAVDETPHLRTQIDQAGKHA